MSGILTFDKLNELIAEFGGPLPKVEYRCGSLAYVALKFKFGAVEPGQTFNPLSGVPVIEDSQMPLWKVQEWTDGKLTNEFQITMIVKAGGNDARE